MELFCFVFEMVAAQFILTDVYSYLIYVSSAKYTVSIKQGGCNV